MGNCQAVDAAALVVQHPDGKLDRYYGPVPVAEIMRIYPGHYVSLIIPIPETNVLATTTKTVEDDKSERKIVKFTRVKLLRPTESLVLGHAYRLITSQEVMKVLRAKKYAKTKKHQSETTKEEKKTSLERKVSEESDKNRNLETNDEKQRAVLTSSGSSKSKTWRPSLQSISEAAS
ncbi:D-ribose-binding periplasmic protein [Hirschfeldia incana]|nr:D-ribose-binding periplasmic protein [Hirschfeldia incana]